MRGNSMSVKATVLVIDDEREIRDFLYFILKDKYAVSIMTGAKESLTYMTEHSVNVVLIDYNMPGIDGITALGEIKKHYPDTEVIMMTGYAPPDTMRKAFRLGAFAFLMKPLNIEELIRTIDAALL
ncbi:MAG: response regulator [Nitrospiraceae bacterium]|nr:MAG: response regulator [Nitrospiraceae bacterium]